MSELSNLLNRLRQTAGLDTRTLGIESDTNGSADKRPMPEVHPSGEELLLEAVRSWAGADSKRWDRILQGLKRDWSPLGWIPDSPRDLLVAWAAASLRLIEAKSAYEKLAGTRRLTSPQRAALVSREVDMRFYADLARAMAQGKRLGRPPGSKDKKKRSRRGYLLRWAE